MRVFFIFYLSLVLFLFFPTSFHFSHRSKLTRTTVLVQRLNFYNVFRLHLISPLPPPNSPLRVLRKKVGTLGLVTRRWFFFFLLERKRRREEIIEGKKRNFATSKSNTFCMSLEAKLVVLGTQGNVRLLRCSVEYKRRCLT